MKASRPQLNREIMMTFISVSVCLATIMSAIVVYLTIKTLVRSNSGTPIVGLRFSNAMLVLVTIIFPFAWFFGFVVGGNFGGAVASNLAGTLFSERVLIPIGIGIGIFICTTFVSIFIPLVVWVIARCIKRS